jgi:POT family proton-dependent oligopeptide transporter
MAFDRSFFLALLLLILGSGAYRGNIAPQLGELYSKEDRRRGTAFQLYGMVINLGAFVAPLVTGLLGKEYGWHTGFAFAGVGMFIGVVVYLSGRRYLPAERARNQKREAAPPLTPEEKRSAITLLLLVPLITTFWVAQSQVWNIYNIWARDHIDLNIGGWTMPVPWLQSLDGLAPLLFIPVMLSLWRWQARRGNEPDDFTKIALGCFIFGLGTLWLSATQLVAGSDGRAPLLWAVMFHIVSNIGWIYFSPTVTGLYSRLAPKSINATMVGVAYLAVFLGSVVSGRLGGLYESLSPAAFWAMHAAIVAAGGAGVFLLGIFARRALSVAAPLPAES